MNSRNQPASADSAQLPATDHHALQPLPLEAVRIADQGFWGARRRTNRAVTLGSQLLQLRTTGRLRPLEPGYAGGRHPFWDSDIAKWLEAVAEEHRGGSCPAELLAAGRAVLRAFADVQDTDGYLGTWLRHAPERRYTDLRNQHELYTMGHLLEACCAWRAADPEPAASSMAERLIDHLWTAFGPAGRPGLCGHPELELALMRWWRLAGDQRARTLAALMVDRRGAKPSHFDAAGQVPWDGHMHGCPESLVDHLPVRAQESCVGHAVRALYLYCGMTDLCVAGDASLRAPLERLWDSLTTKHLYLTAGVGAVQQGERFGADRQLPDAEAYCETCASIALARWASRMLQLELTGAYGDVLERALANTVLSGVALDGEHYFYSNPLAVDAERSRTGDNVAPTRVPWFGCACCPPNVARTISQLGGFAYSGGDDTTAIHLYISGTAQVTLGGEPASLVVESALPWSGRVRIQVRAQRPLDGTIALRIPAWSDQARLRVAGAAVAVAAGTYARVTRTWSDGEVIELELPMTVARVHAHPAVRALAGRVALTRGPLVFAFEEVDQQATSLADIALPDGATIHAEPDTRLGGCVVLRMQGTRTQAQAWDGPLYRTVTPAREGVALTAVPYCLWGNRGAGEMRVWIRREA